MPASLVNNRSVARQVTLTAIALVALVLVLVGLAIAVLTERSTRAQVVRSVGYTAQSVAQSLDAAAGANWATRFTIMASKRPLTCWQRWPTSSGIACCLPAF